MRPRSRVGSRARSTGHSSAKEGWSGHAADSPSTGWRTKQRRSISGSRRIGGEHRHPSLLLELMTWEGDISEGWIPWSAQVLNVVDEDDVASDRVTADRCQLCA